MAKLFSTKTHGVLDYLTVAQLIALPRMLGWSSGVTNLLTGAAINTLGYSLLTRYELGAYKVLPMKGHLALDAVSGATLLAAPMFFPKESTTVKAALIGLGVFEIMASLSTETEPSFGEQADQFGENMADTFGDATDRLQERALGA